MVSVRRMVPMLLGAALLYLGWELLSANGLKVDVDFLAGRLEAVALWKALAGSFLLGAGAVGCVLLLYVVRGRLTMRRYRTRLSGLETEVHQLRNLPLVPDELGPDPVGSVVRGSATSPPN
jgi:hypothetical protein